MVTGTLTTAANSATIEHWHAGLRSRACLVACGEAGILCRSKMGLFSSTVST